jgi:hypothetical protein
MSNSFQIPPAKDEQQQTSMTIASEFLEEIAMAPNTSIHKHVIIRPPMLRPSLTP